MAHAGLNLSWLAWGGLLAVAALGGHAFHQGDALPVRLALDVEQRGAQALAHAGFSWARLDVKETVGELHGEAPSEDARAAALDAARQVLAPYMGLPGVFAELDNRIRVKAPVPAQRLQVALAADAVTPSPAATDALAPAPDTTVLPAIADAEPPRACVDALNATMRSAAVRFKPRSAELPGTARPAIRRLTQLAGRCEGWRLVIEGHPDKNTTRSASRRLMQRRAVAVASALLLEGVPVTRLALQTDDSRLRTPGSDPKAQPFDDRVTFHLVP